MIAKSIRMRGTMKSVRNVLIPLVAITFVISLTSCERTDDGKKAATSAPVPLDAQTSTANSIDAAIPPAKLKLVYKIVEGPFYDPQSDFLSYTISVANEGKVTLRSKGTRPVNLGVVILGPDGSHRTPPGNRGFVRVRLPRPIAPGDEVEIPIGFRMTPTIGGSVVLDGVQERVRWFSDYKKPTLLLGAFIRCGKSEASACTANGKPVPSRLSR
jgi:hypothetical protein